MQFLGKSSLAAFAGPVLTAALAACPARAQDMSDRVGTAEFQFLETLVPARAAGLAGAYASLAQGEDAVGVNPAGLSRLETSRSISAAVRYHFVETTSGSFTYAFPGPDSVRFAFSAGYMSYGTIDGLDEQGNPLGETMAPAAFNPAFTAARRIGESLRAGVTLKGISEYLGDFDGSQVGLGWGLDAGLQLQPRARNLGFGVSLLNVGTKIASQVEGGETGGLLPATLEGGMFYHPLALPKARLSLDLELPWHDAPRLAGGLEYAYLQSLTLRAGTRFDYHEIKHAFLQATGQDPDAFEGGNALKAACGFTFQAEGIGIDYAAQYWLGLSWVHALTFRYAVL